MNNFQKCKIFLEKCIDIKLSPAELSSLLEGDLEKDNTLFQYLGGSFNFKESVSKNAYNVKKLIDTTIYYQDGIEIIYNEMNNSLEIRQKHNGAKAFFLNGKIENMSIYFEGYSANNELNRNDPIGFPINEKGLTGCLSFINLEVKDIKIIASNSPCEDTVNFINTSGVLKNIEIENSMSDALDVDFSNLDVERIKIKSAGNDCVDFSYGNYKIESLIAYNCGDKALSVGEKSKLTLKKIIASESVIGIASKDSSVVNFDNAIFDSLETCLEAYKKKQEFDGGIINFSKMECNYRKQEILHDKNSLISRQN